MKRTVATLTSSHKSWTLQGLLPEAVASNPDSPRRIDMSNLSVGQDLNTIPQAITDQDSNTSGLFITNAATGVTSIESTGRFVFGIAPFGIGEWIQNSQGVSGDFGISFFGAANERMRLTNTGQLGIGTTTPSAALHVNGDMKVEGLAQFKELVKQGQMFPLAITPDGYLALVTNSERFNENIGEFSDDFNKILSLNPVSFQSRKTGETGFGYIAEDLQEKDLTNLVSYDAEGKPFSVRYELMPVYLLEVLKEQQKMITELQSEVAELKSRS
jgi:hypothetical protein